MIMWLKGQTRMKMAL